MGYQTDYSLKLRLRTGTEIFGELAHDIITDLRSESEEAENALDADGGCSGNESRWYESVRVEEMRAFSKLHPRIIFELHGEGEEAGDIWTEYYYNGKSHHEKAVMTIAPFDESKLK